MNATLQTEIREFIGDDPAQAVKRVRFADGTARQLLNRVMRRRPGDGFEDGFLESYNLAAYGGGLVAVLFPFEYAMDRRGRDCRFHYVDYAAFATADAETRIAAMLWAAAWIVEVNENE